MMRMTQGWTGLRTAVVALGLFAGASTGANADSILSYSTAGSIDASVSNDGVTGANVISFVPITSASVDANSNLSLGFFQVAAESGSASTTYNNTPFSITYVPGSIDGNAITGQAATITGVLNGTVTGNNFSTVVATFTSLTSPSSQVIDGSNLVTSTLSIPQGSLFLVPSLSNNGESTAEGTVVSTGVPVNETPAPEPSTIALFLSTVGGLGLRKYVLGRRQRNEA
jgi:hypothetical protein